LQMLLLFFFPCSLADSLFTFPVFQNQINHYDLVTITSMNDFPWLISFFPFFRMCLPLWQCHPLLNSYNSSIPRHFRQCRAHVVEFPLFHTLGNTFESFSSPMGMS
jgi:hypothetical protein